MRKLLYAVILASGVLAAIWTLFGLRALRLSPFATGTRDVAFLETTFGMSPQEVGRALAKSDARLLTGDEYRRETASDGRTLHLLLLPDSFIPVIAEDRARYESFFMPSIRMWESSVEAKFEFRDQRLAFVEIDVDPLKPIDAAGVVSSLDTRLRRSYQFRRREASNEVPGAYTLHYDSKAAAPMLWVNLTAKDRPIISLNISHPPTVAAMKREVEDRQQRVFGRN